ncbi:hypothetical protein ACR6C2_13995 [Streptomyces sp. INA 01156]
MHGAFAFAGVADFWRVERHALHGHRADLAHFEFAVWRDAVTQALRSLSAPEPQACLTDWGRRFVARLASWTAPWAREQAPPRPLATARAEGVDLRVTWRLHHLRADPARCASWRSDGGRDSHRAASTFPWSWGGRERPVGASRAVSCAACSSPTANRRAGSTVRTARLTCSPPT